MLIDRRNVLQSASLLAAASMASAGPSRAIATSVGTTRQSPKFAALDVLMQKAVDNGSVAGVVAVGASPNGIAYQGGFGKANTANGTPMSMDTVFWLLSMTKAFTAAACMQLVQQGRVHLDQEASTILPQLAQPKVLEGFDANGQPRLRPAKRPITVRHLLTHTSGYTYSIWSERLTQYEKTTGMPDIATCQNAAFAAPLEFDPGERWQYGIGMDWIGKLIEAVSDQSLEIYFRENIFSPLGMKDSGFLIGSAQKRRVATFHNRQSDGTLVPAEFEMPQRPEFFMGGGGAYSTPNDYMIFLRMLLNDGTLNGAQILRPETVASMMQNQIGQLEVVEMKSAQSSFSNSFNQFPGQAHKWGLSFDINHQAVAGGRSAGSISWAGLLNCYFWLDPHNKVAGALFTQMLPFFDDRVVALYGDFERTLYRALNHT